MKRSDIKQFIDFFHDAALRIRKQKPRIIRGKDGKLVKRALALFSRQQLEMLAVWFLAKKIKLSPTIGAMLSDVVLEELARKIRSSAFWNDLDMFMERYFPRQIDILPLKTKHPRPRQGEAEGGQKAFSLHDLNNLRQHLIQNIK